MLRIINPVCKHYQFRNKLLKKDVFVISVMGKYSLNLKV